MRHLAAPSCSPFVCSLHSQPQRWLEYGRLAALPLAILPIPPDSSLAASPTGRARLESPVNGDSFWVCNTMCQFSPCCIVRRTRSTAQCRRPTWWLEAREDRKQQNGKEKNSPFGLFFSLVSGSYLSSRAVASQVLSAYKGLTSVFGMGTGGTPWLNHRNGYGVFSTHLENCIAFQFASIKPSTY